MTQGADLRTSILTEGEALEVMNGYGLMPTPPKDAPGAAKREAVS